MTSWSLQTAVTPDTVKIMKTFWHFRVRDWNFLQYTKPCVLVDPFLRNCVTLFPIFRIKRPKEKKRLWHSGRCIDTSCFTTDVKSKTSRNLIYIQLMRKDMRCLSTFYLCKSKIDSLFQFHMFYDLIKDFFCLWWDLRCNNYVYEQLELFTNKTQTTPIVLKWI